MRILLVSQTGDGAWFILRLAQERNELSWVLGKDKYCETLAGLIPPPVEKVDDPESYDLVVFDQTGYGKIADEWREHTPVIGDSQLADKLEHDRVFGIEFMEQAGIKVPSWEGFDSIERGIAWLARTKRRCVFKPCGKVDDAATTYVSKSCEDLERYLRQLADKGNVKEFILQEYVEGTEVSTEAWFNGTDWFALNHTLEEKKFMAGRVGPNTGCAGNMLWMPQQPTTLFALGLARAGRALADQGYVGPIDLNTIATDGELFGLEWCPRFGYEGTCNLTRLLPMKFGEFLCTIATGGTLSLAPSRAAFSATVRLSVPPYPSPATPEKHAGIPVEGIDLDRLDCWYLSDVKLNAEGELETIGTDGFIGCPIAVGETPGQAFQEIESAISRLRVPNLQYRVDIRKCCQDRYEKLLSQGWLRTAAAVSTGT